MCGSVSSWGTRGGSPAERGSSGEDSGVNLRFLEGVGEREGMGSSTGSRIVA